MITMHITSGAPSAARRVVEIRTLPNVIADVTTRGQDLATGEQGGCVFVKDCARSIGPCPSPAGRIVKLRSPRSAPFNQDLTCHEQSGGMGTSPSRHVASQRPGSSRGVIQFGVPKRVKATVAAGSDHLAAEQQGGRAPTAWRVERAGEGPVTGCRMIELALVQVAAEIIPAGHEYLAIGQQGRGMIPSGINETARSRPSCIGLRQRGGR